MFTFEPCDDIYRYLWESKVWHNGLSPYLFAPDNPILAPLRDAHWAQINHPDFPAIYPPFTQIIFSTLGYISNSIWFYKMAFIGFDMLCFYQFNAFSRQWSTDTKKHSQWAALFFLNPLWILEVAGRGHFEGIYLCFILLSVLALQKKHPESFMGYWGLSFLIKGSSLFLLPLTFNRLNKVRQWMHLLATMIVCFWILSRSGALQNLQRFGSELQYNSIIPFLWQKILGPIEYVKIGFWMNAFTFIAAALYGIYKLRHESIPKQALFWMGLGLCISPTLHPWYLLWILPFAVWTESKPWLLFTGTILCTYWVYAQALSTGLWQEIPNLRFYELAPPLLLLGIIWLRRKILPLSA